jgi:hypothetical protein
VAGQSGMLEFQDEVALEPGGASQGRFAVVGGTGALGGLHGTGTFQGASGAGTYTGQLAAAS